MRKVWFHWWYLRGNAWWQSMVDDSQQLTMKPHILLNHICWESSMGLLWGNR